MSPLRVQFPLLRPWLQKFHPFGFYFHLMSPLRGLLFERVSVSRLCVICCVRVTAEDQDIQTSTRSTAPMTLPASVSRMLEPLFHFLHLATRVMCKVAIAQTFQVHYIVQL
jgi:hypothetical protein